MTRSRFTKVPLDGLVDEEGDGAVADVIARRLIRLLLEKAILTPEDVLGILARVNLDETRH